MKKVELLIPAGSFENLEVGIAYGADAVYIGGDVLGLRARAKNFDIETMDKAIKYAHKNKVKVYVTTNIIAHNEDLEIAKKYFKELNQIRPDAIIVADPGMLMLAKDHLEGIELHLSTQANTTNYASYNFWYSQGIRRIVAAREMSIKDIKETRKKIPKDMDIEAFVHGAMCMAYSGRCMLSNFMTGRDANHGDCSQSCRWKYHITEATRPGEYMPIEGDEDGTYIFNSKDLCMLGHLDDLLLAGVNSLKIEGRMKTPLYTAIVTKTYRRALDDLFESVDKYNANKKSYLEEIQKCSHREYFTGFYYGKPDSSGQVHDYSGYVRKRKFIGKVLDYRDGFIVVEQRNKFSVGEEIEIINKEEDNDFLIVDQLFNEKGDKIDSAPHAQEIVKIKSNKVLEKNTILCKKIEN